jgi:hypothetical protein
VKLGDLRVFLYTDYENVTKVFDHILFLLKKLHFIFFFKYVNVNMSQRFSVENGSRAAHRFHGPLEKFSVRAPPKLSQPIEFFIIRNTDSTIPYLLVNFTC